MDRPLARQSAALLALTSRVEAHPDVVGAVLVGSMVAGETDALSDVDCIVVTNHNAFDSVWSDRCSLHVTAPDSGVRIAPPHRVVAGPTDVAAFLEPRPPVKRSEMRGLPVDITHELDVETAYDILKQVVRRQRER